MSLIALMTELPPKCTTEYSSIKKQKIFSLFKKKESNKVYPSSNNIVLDLT